MPDILITLGTFNAPGTLAEVHGVLDFPRVPVQAPKRVPLQWASRYVEEAVPVVVEDNIVFTKYVYHTGECFVRTPPVDVVGGFPIVISGARYVPAGSYPSGTVSNYFGQPNYRFMAGSSGFTAAAHSLGHFLLSPYKAAGRTTDGAEYSLRARLQINLSLLGADDGAVYTVQSAVSGEFFTQSGTSPMFDISLFYRDNASDFSAETFSIPNTIDITLYRDGVYVDQISVDIRLNFAVSSAASWDAADEGGSPDYCNVGWADALYGPGVTITDVSQPAIPLMGYSRSSYGITQGTLTPTL